MTLPDHADDRRDLALRTSDAELLATLADDRSSDVREAVAGNPHCAIETLWRLSNDADDFTREAVASNPTAPSELVEKLAIDPDISTREAALRRLPPASKLVDEVRRMNATERRYLAEEKQDGGNTLRRLPSHQRAAAIARLEQAAALGGGNLRDWD